MTTTIGIDIGGTSVEAVATDGEAVLGRAQAPTPTDGLDALVEVVAGLVAQCGAAAGSPPATVGVGVPGVVDPVAGTVSDAVNLHLGTQAPLAARLAARLDAAVAIENDVRAGALEVLRLLQVDDPTRADVVLLNLGTGVNAGIVVAGHLLRGPRGTAGEIGHAPVLGDDVRCACGGTGCLEARIAGPALARRWPHGDATHLFTRAAAGDPDARVLAGEVADDVAHAVHWLAATTGIDAVWLGGGIGVAHPSLAELVRERLTDATRNSAVANHLLAPERLGVAPADHPTGALGAAALAAAGTPLHHPDDMVVGVPRAGREHT